MQFNVTTPTGNFSSVTVKFLLSLLFSAFSYQLLQAQYITNVRAEQTGERVTIYYDIKDTDPGQTFNVKVRCSTDGGSTFGSLLQSVTGDVNEGVRGGSSKNIIWNVLDDRHELVGSDIVFKVLAYPHSITKKSGDFSYELLSCTAEGRVITIKLLITNQSNQDINFWIYANNSTYVLDEMSRATALSSVELTGRPSNSQIIATNSYAEMTLVFDGVDPTATRISTFNIAGLATIEFKDLLIER